MKNLINSVITLSLLLFFSCSKDDPKPYVPVKRCPELTRNIDTVNQYIFGKWEWLEERKFDRLKGEYIYYTPQSPGWHNISAKFSSDTARISGYGPIDSVFRFRIQKMSDFTNFPGDSTLTVLVYYSFHTGNRLNQIPVMICQDQLIMQFQLYSDDRGESIWKRE